MGAGYCLRMPHMLFRAMVGDWIRGILALIKEEAGGFNGQARHITPEAKSARLKYLAISVILVEMKIGDMSAGKTSLRIG